MCKTTTLHPDLDPCLSGYFGSNKIGQVPIKQVPIKIFKRSFNWFHRVA